jgi:transcriptional regulator with XRE-family HTH domain
MRTSLAAEEKLQGLGPRPPNSETDHVCHLVTRQGVMSMPSSIQGHHSSPPLLRRRLGTELRRLREAAALTTDKVAAVLYCSSSKISRVETGRVTATPRDVRDMLELYGVGGKQREDLLQLAHEARRKDAWWHSYRDVPDVRTFMSLEKSAQVIRVYASAVIPGLLQIEEYARRITRVILPGLGCQEVARHVELRLARQMILDGDDAPALRVVLDEAALQRLAGMSKFAREQLRRLIEVDAMPNVTLQVLPFGAGAHGGMIGPFTILSFPDQADPDVVHIESPTASDVYLDSADEVQRFGVLFEHLQATALAPDASVAFLVALEKEL